MTGIKSKRPCYRNTELRLYAYSGIKAALKNDLFTLKNNSNKDTAELRRRIENNSMEIARIDNAVNSLSDDAYKSIIRLKYQCKKTDEEIAEILSCDSTTVRRNKRRLVERIAVYLYGTDALSEQIAM